MAVVRRHREELVPLITRGDHGEGTVFRDPWSVTLPGEAPREARTWPNIETAMRALSMPTD